MGQNSRGFGFSVTQTLCSVIRNLWLLLSRECFTDPSHVWNKSGVCCLFYGCMFVFVFFVILMGTKQVYLNYKNVMESSLTFLSVGFVLLEVLLFFVSVELLPCIQYWSCDYAGTRMQKARPYGRCLIAILTKKRLGNGPQGHSLTPTTVHHKRQQLYTHSQSTVACELYDILYAFSVQTAVLWNICYVYGNTATAFFMLTIKSIFLHNMC